ncbi:MAG: class I SAM-dependent methyltransferase [Burkholderiaceae bacterium]
MNFWNQQFSLPDFKYGKQPNSFLREQAFRLRPGSKVLLPGDGEGRNSVWLAQQGHHVTAMDNSCVGLQKAQELAAEKGVQIEVVQADLEHWTPAVASFDALVLTYVHLPPAMRAQAHRRLVQALRPSGWLILEAFHPRQLGRQSGGPKDEAMLYTLDMLRSDLAATSCLEPVIAWEGEALLDEGSGHQGLAFLTRYVAQRAPNLSSAPATKN